MLDALPDQTTVSTVHEAYMVSTKANKHPSFISPARIQQGCPGVSGVVPASSCCCDVITLEYAGKRKKALSWNR